MVFPLGLGGAWWWGSGLASSGCCRPGDPLVLGSVVGWRALLLSDVLQHSLGLAARESPRPSPRRAQALKAVWASTCHRLARSSTGS